MVIRAIILISLFTFQVKGQSTISRFIKLGAPEKRWVLLHPFIAKKSFIITQLSLDKYKEVLLQKKLDTLESGGKLDAFRHGLWMAMLCQKIKMRKALSLGKAHEKSNYRDYKKGKLEDNLLPDKESSDMDLYNNCIGAHIGLQNKNQSLDYIIEKLIESIQQGKLVVLKRDSQGRFVTCDNKPINLKSKSWKSNKCLVPSSFNP